MTQPRSRIVDEKLTRWYHCLSRCVRNAFLISDQNGFDRKAWIDHRLKELESIFAISVAGFSVMDNHLHLLLRIDSETAQSWTPLEVATKWLELYPPRINRKRVTPTFEMIELYAANVDWVQKIRTRLSSLSWFMKCLKEPLSRLVNREENCRGTFFEGRFKSIAILDDESLLTVAAYIDLNPLAAGMVSLPEQSPHTSIKERIDNVVAQGRLRDVEAIRNGSVQAQKVSEGIEEDHWLIPIEDRRRHGAIRAGIKEGFTLGQYLMLVDCSSRMVRDGKANVPSEVQSIFERMEISASRWVKRLSKLLTGKRLFGSFMATTRERLNKTASELGVSQLCSTA